MIVSAKCHDLRKTLKLYPHIGHFGMADRSRWSPSKDEKQQFRRACDWLAANAPGEKYAHWHGVPEVRQAAAKETGIYICEGVLLAAAFALEMALEGDASVVTIPLKWDSQILFLRGMGETTCLPQPDNTFWRAVLRKILELTCFERNRNGLDLLIDSDRSRIFAASCLVSKYWESQHNCEHRVSLDVLARIFEAAKGLTFRPEHVAVALQYHDIDVVRDEGQLYTALNCRRMLSHMRFVEQSNWPRIREVARDLSLFQHRSA